MSQQWLYPIFQFRGYRVNRVETEERRLLLHVEPQPHRVGCPQCGSREVIRRGEQVRWFRNVPVGSDCTWLIATLPRVECRACQIVRQIPLGLADPRRTYTRAFARYVLELSKYMTIKDVANQVTDTGSNQPSDVVVSRAAGSKLRQPVSARDRKTPRLCKLPNLTSSGQQVCVSPSADHRPPSPSAPLATISGNKSPTYASHAHIFFASLKKFVTQVGWIKYISMASAAK